MKKYASRFLPIILILAFALVVSLGVTSFVLSQTDEPNVYPRNYNEDGTHSEGSTPSEKGINLATGDPTLLKRGKVYNIVIFICFADENPTRMFPSSTTSEIERAFNGDNSSMKNYYETLSYGAFSVESAFVKQNASYFVYQDSKNRKYYENVKDDSGKERYVPESTLLNNAVAAANEYFSLTSDEIDRNNDGYVDSVSFVVSGAYDNAAWGHLLWPHSWNLNTITGLASSDTSSSALAGVKVDTYTLTFADNFEVGLVTHEFGHVVGLPDLYHYYDNKSDNKSGYPANNRSYLPVGQWDLMHNNTVIPQFTLSYIRDSYLGFLDKKQIVELSESGTYTLKPTPLASKNDVVAYKVTVSEKESIWFEYRNNSETVSAYDSGLPSSGLIVYRVNNSVSGNTAAKYNNTASFPEEVYVYRPSVASESLTITEKEKYNLARAALNKEADGRSSLGNATTTVKYSSSAIFLSDGTNTGIGVTVTEMNNGSITFNVNLGKYDGNDISDSFVMGKTLDGTSVKNKHYAYFGEKLDISVYLIYSARSKVPVELTTYSLRYEENVCPEGQTAYVVFTDKTGERTIPFTLYVYDAVKLEATVLKPPQKTTIAAGETLSLIGLTMEISYSSGRTETVVCDESNEDLFVICEGFDNKVHGKYDHVRICYDGKIYCTLKGIEVLSEITALIVENTDSQRFYGDAFALSLNVVASFLDGSTRKLEEDEYSLTVPDGGDFDKVKAVVCAKTAPEIKAETEVLLTGSHSVSGIEISAYPTSYRASGSEYLLVDYGYDPNFDGGEITVSFDNGKKIAVEMNSFKSLLLSSYSPTKTGEQTVRATIGRDAKFSFSLKIKVLPMSSSSLISLISGSPCEKTIKIYNVEKIIVVSSAATLSEFASSLNTYALTKVFLDENEDYELPLNAFGSRAVGHNLKMRLLTAGGVTMTTYSIFLSGDADGDGAITDADVNEWIDALFYGETKITHFDVNEDGFFTLTDFVMLLNRYKGGQQ